MSIRTNILFIPAFLTIIVMLSACNQQKTIDKIYTVLENVVATEKGFEEQQVPLSASEKEEKRLYDQIAVLGANQHNEIVKLANQASIVVDRREKYIKKETQSIKASEKEFRSFSELKGKLKDKKLKKLANDLEQIMLDRYREHAVLTQNYLNGIQYDKQLYQMFQQKNLSVDQLEAQIDKLNASYKRVYVANDRFNQLTEQYNAKKTLFYQDAGLKLNDRK